MTKPSHARPSLALAFRALLLATILSALPAVAGSVPHPAEDDPADGSEPATAPRTFVCRSQGWDEVPCGTPLAMYCTSLDGLQPCADIGYTFPGVEDGMYCLDQFCKLAPGKRR